MKRTTNTGPPADGGYPADSDLHQMTDDGGPPAPDPARWADPVWRDNFGDMDTFGGTALARPASPGGVMSRPAATCPKCGERFSLGDPGVRLTPGADGAGAACPACGDMIPVGAGTLHRARVARGEASDDSPAAYD